MKAVMICLGLGLPFAVFGQDRSKQPASAAPAGWGTLTIQLKYVDAEEVRRLFSSQSYIVAANPELNLLTARGPTGFLKEVEETAKRLDIAPLVPRNIEVIVYLLAAAAPGSLPVDLPPELSGLDKDLKAMFGNQLWRLRDSHVIRVRSGTPADATGLTTPSEDAPTLSWVRFRCASEREDGKRSIISLDGLRVGLKIPSAAGPGRTPLVMGGEVAADLDLIEGQLAIIGNSGSDRPSVLILRAKTVE